MTSQRLENPFWRYAVFLPLVGQLALLALAGWHFRHALNPDGIAYLRIAHYYATGNTELMVSGYWGPMLSWLMAPLLGFGCPRLLTARLVMAATAIGFLLVSIHTFRRFRLPNRAVTAGSLLVACASILWSVENITPDLLVAIWILLAFNAMSRRTWVETLSRPFLSGILWGLAYLAKAVAFPLACLMIPVMTLIWWRPQAHAGRDCLKAAILTLAGLMIVATPWIAILSAKYGGVTLSTSAPIVHAAAGPDTVERYPLGREFKKPEPGRLTTWEDPSLREEQYWSPLSNWRNALHQMKLILRNLVVVNAILSSIHLLWPIVVAAFGGALFWSRWREECFRFHWWWALIPIALLAALYLPAYLPLTEQRYFYAALPWSFVVTVGLLNRLAAPTISHPTPKRYAIVVLAISFLIPVGIRWILLPARSESAWHDAYELSERLEGTDLAGPIAGSGMLPRGRSGLYLAFFLKEPWYGDALNPTPDQFYKTGASLIVVRRDRPIRKDLAQDHRFQNLDQRLFDPEEAVQRFPLVVFQRVAFSDSKP